MNFFVILMTIVMTATAPLTRADAVKQIEVERRRFAVEQIEEQKNEYLEQIRLAEEAERKAEEQRRADERARTQRTQVAEINADAPEQTEATAEPATETEVQAQDEAQTEMRLLGNYNLTFYCGCEIHCGNSVGAAGVGLTPYRSVAMQGVAMGTEVYISGSPGYDGWYVVQDISPRGIIDIFVNHHSEIPSWGTAKVQVYVR